MKDGGPAFPQNDLSSYGMGPSEIGNGGMTLRDWFAGQALAGIASGHDETGMWMWRPGEAAEAAYLAADAMLAARTDGGDDA